MKSEVLGLRLLGLAEDYRRLDAEYASSPSIGSAA